MRLLAFVVGQCRFAFRLLVLGSLIVYVASVARQCGFACCLVMSWTPESQKVGLAIVCAPCAQRDFGPHSRTMKPARVRKVLSIFLHDELLKSFLDYDSYADFVKMLLQSENGVMTAELVDSYLVSIIQ